MLIRFTDPKSDTNENAIDVVSCFVEDPFLKAVRIWESYDRVKGAKVEARQEIFIPLSRIIMIEGDVTKYELLPSITNDPNDI